MLVVYLVETEKVDNRKYPCVTTLANFSCERTTLTGPVVRSVAGGHTAVVLYEWFLPEPEVPVLHMEELK